MKTILFDGVCNLCNSSVNWVIDHDKNNLFHFASLQSEVGKKKLEEIGHDESYMDSILLDDEGQTFAEADAVLRILKHLGGVYSFAGIFWLVPRFIRNFVYKLVAKNRYKWFGKQDNCWVPTPELKAKFLE